MTLNPLRAFYDWWGPRYKKRVAVHLESRLPRGASVLDVGCDDGSVPAQILASRKDLTFQGVDIQDLRPCQIPRQLYDGTHIPFPDTSFDVVMAVDVLHHTPDISVVLADMARVSRRYLLIKDHVVFGAVTRWAVGFTDWLSNVSYGIKCVYNYPTMPGWEKLFAGAGLTCTEVSYAFLGRSASKKHNPFFLLEKAAVSRLG